jgi:hypothetical protein
MEPQNIFQGMKINNFYKYILYISGIILTLSLFFEVKGIDLNMVRHASLTFVIIGLIVWIISDIFDSISNYYSHLESQEEISESKAKEIAVAMLWLWYIITILVLLFGGFIAFS